MRKTFRYRLYPTKAQVETLEHQLELCRELYNAALQERRDAWRIGRVSLGFNAQSAQLPAIKAERPEMAGIYSQVLQAVLHRVDKNFQAFFRRTKQGLKAGFPRFRSVARYDSLTYPQLGFALEARHLKLAKIGRIKIKLHRALRGKIKTLTLKREADKWYACFSVEDEAEPLPESREAIGIDVGLRVFATLSDGTEIENPRYSRAAQARLRKAQRKVSRRKKGSHRRRKAVRLLQSAHTHVRQQRADFHHQVARSLVNQYGLIAVEDLNVKGLAAGLFAKSVNDAGWSSFIAKLTDKAACAGRVLVKVDPRGTSQSCLCGAQVPKTLSRRWHECGTCGLSAPRDQVSAQLVLGRGLRLQSVTWPVGASVL
jgi:putative transposase